MSLSGVGLAKTHRNGYNEDEQAELNAASMDQCEADEEYFNRENELSSDPTPPEAMDDTGDDGYEDPSGGTKRQRIGNESQPGSQAASEPASQPTDFSAQRGWISREVTRPICDSVSARPTNRPRRVAESGSEGEQDDEPDESDDRPCAAHGEAHVHVDARNFEDFNYQHFGKNIQSNPPIFHQGTCSNPTWQSYDQCGSAVLNMRPVRSMCWNIPAELFARDGARFRHWSTPSENSKRASHIAAILGMAFTPTSKGFMSGNHEETQRLSGTEEDEEKPDDKKKKITRVYRYAFMLPTNNNITAPMFVIAYQELYNSALTEVTAIRVWKFARSIRFNHAHRPATGRWLAKLSLTQRHNLPTGFRRSALGFRALAKAHGREHGYIPQRRHCAQPKRDSKEESGHRAETEPRGNWWNQ